MMESHDSVSLREYMDARFLGLDSRFQGLEQSIGALEKLTQRELTLLSEDRERQRHDLSERLEGMNALRAQLDRQAGTFATNERVAALERTTWRALGILAGLVMVVQVVVSLVLKG
jgi:hypothetical protein